MKLQLYNINNRYAFCVGRFSSTRHFLVCPDISSTYKYAWEAYRDATNLYKKQPSHILATNKYASDDLSISEISSQSDMSAEEMVFTHYAKVLDIISDRIREIKSDDDRKIAYDEIKGIVSGVLKVKESMENNKDKQKIEDILVQFRRIVNSEFQDLLENDKKELEESEKSKKDADDQPSPEEEKMDLLSGDETMTEDMPTTPSDLQTIQSSNIDAIMVYGSKHVLNDIRTEILDGYSEKICRCLQDLHPSLIYKNDYDKGNIGITMAEGNPLLKIGFNDDLNLVSIDPDSGLVDNFPLQSLEFYQRYWKPIVEAVGHFLSEDTRILMLPKKCALPDIPNDYPHSVKMNGFDVDNKVHKDFSIMFHGDNPIWKIGLLNDGDILASNIEFMTKISNKAYPSKYTEDDFIRNQPQRVVCIDPDLESIYMKTGEVIQVIPLEDHLEIDVDFGRQVVRLTENQFNIV